MKLISGSYTLLWDYGPFAFSTIRLKKGYSSHPPMPYLEIL